MDIQINQTYAKIGIDRTPGNLEIQSQNARLELHQKQAKINIHTELPKVQIDQHECFASAGLKNVFELTKEAADRGYQQAMEYIGKTAADGYSLSAIENGGNAIAEIAKKNSTTVHEFGLDFLPKVGPKIDVTGSIEYDPERNSEGINNAVEGNFIPGSLNINYTPAKVSIFMKQYSSVDIQYVGSNIDTSV